MWFFGNLDLGKSVTALRKQGEYVRQQKIKFDGDVAKAIETRNTVIAAIGEEISELKLIQSLT